MLIAVGSSEAKSFGLLTDRSRLASITATLEDLRCSVALSARLSFELVTPDLADCELTFCLRNMTTSRTRARGIDEKEVGKGSVQMLQRLKLLHDARDYLEDPYSYLA